jgi:hypothetical protein
MIDFAWIIHTIAHRDIPDIDADPYRTEFDADPVAFVAKYSEIYPKEAGALRLLIA